MNNIWRAARGVIFTMLVRQLVDTWLVQVYFAASTSLTRYTVEVSRGASLVSMEGLAQSRHPGSRSWCNYFFGLGEYYALGFHAEIGHLRQRVA